MAAILAFLSNEHPTGHLYAALGHTLQQDDAVCRTSAALDSWPLKYPQLAWFAEASVRQESGSGICLDRVVLSHPGKL
jgi:hypothetical protein